jgi:uncharacterized phage-associated protein
VAAPSSLTRDGAHDPRAIANKILEICKADGRSVTLMQLIKLVYLADGWSMALRDAPLSKLPPQAWQYGPVYPTVYKAFKRFGTRPVTEAAADNASGIEIVEEFSTDELALIRQVVDSYGKFHAFRLSEIMHQPGTPWTTTVEKSGNYAEIPIDVIANHFRSLRETRGVRAAN